MWWIVVIAVIGGLILLGILILSIPFDLAWRLEVPGKPVFSFRWAWLFGLVSREVKPGRRAKKKKRKEPSAEKPQHDRLRINRTFRNIRTAAGFFQIKGLMKEALKLGRRTLSRLRIRKLEADFRVGLDDPADTVYLFAFTEPLNRGLDFLQPYPVRIQPSFLGPTFEGYSSGQLRLFPVQLIPPLLLFLFSMPAFRLIKKVITFKWKRNK